MPAVDYDTHDINNNSYIGDKTDAFHWSNGWQTPWEMMDFEDWQGAVNDDFDSAFFMPDHNEDGDADGADLAEHLQAGAFDRAIFIEIFAERFGG